MNMRTLFQSVTILCMGLPAASLAAANAKTILEEGAQTYPPNNANVCVLSGPPPVAIQYEVLARIVATKRTYGSTDELYEPMVREARMIGADAIINLQVGQRFKGPLPWRITSPTGDGQAIKVLSDSSELDCLGVGGKLWGPGGQIVPIPNRSSISESPRVIDHGDNGSAANSVSQGESAPKIDLYKELLQLDDLRQRGILTDAEFQAEKKKLLSEN